MKTKKYLSLLIMALVVVGAFITIHGIGSIHNAKEEMKYGLDIDGGVYVVMEAQTNQKGEDLHKTMEQTKQVLEKRVNAMGVSEATVSIEGTNRFRIEMPGVKDAKQAIKRVGQTAKLRFTTADGAEYMTGSEVKDASAETDSEHGGYKIVMKFTGKGQDAFAKATKAAAKGVEGTLEDGEVGNNSVVIWLDDKVLTAPNVEHEINSTSCEIYRGDGGYSKEEATQTAALIRGGALPVSLKEVSSSVQTASIGANALDKSVVAGAVGLVLVFLLMILMYGLMGILADFALTLYVILMAWIMIGMNVVLTLPGIAGIILGIGMAVDANVIIFSRIREEIGKGKSIRTSTDIGYKNAMTTVLDAQITTLIASIILYSFGTTSVKGFAVTLMIGVILSIFTAVFITKIFVDALAESRFASNRAFGCDKDGKARAAINIKSNIIQKRKIFYIISGVIIVAGLLTVCVRGFNYGIDFTGGTMIQMDMGKKVATADVEKAIKPFDLNETIVYSGKGQKEIIIKTTKALNADQRDKVQKAIEKKFDLKDDAVISSEEFGPTIGQELKGNALKSILLAAIGMLLYIIFRFKRWKYGAAAVSGILHDVLILISLYAIFGLTVNNPFIAAILTIVGYSINDTIVVFDRIRENSGLMKKTMLEDVINRSIEQTVSRSVMTSLTTAVAIIPLMVMVSSQLMQYTLPLLIGVLAGTYSSIFLCSPLYYDMETSGGKKLVTGRGKRKKR